jgi:N-formylglutamate deformylase
MTDQPLSSFITIAGDAASPWILHVPHSSTRIPGSVREWIVLDDDALDAELAAMTDAHADLLARRISERVRGQRPWSFVNRLSRLVVDPERFPDEREVMNSVGMGAVYTRTSTGKRLRADSRRIGASSSRRCSSRIAGRWPTSSMTGSPLPAVW